MSSIPSSFDPAQPVLHHVTCPGASQTDAATHRMAYWAWGDPTNERILVCVHGLSRQGRDFDTLARSLVSPAEIPVGLVTSVIGGPYFLWLLLGRKVREF